MLPWVRINHGIYEPEIFNIKNGIGMKCSGGKEEQML